MVGNYLHGQWPYDTLIGCSLIAPFFLVHEFTESLLKYQYGVFSTHGFENDTRYPRNYRMGDVVLENKGCSNGQVSFFYNLKEFQIILCSSSGKIMINCARPSVRYLTKMLKIEGSTIDYEGVRFFCVAFIVIFWSLLFSLFRT